MGSRASILLAGLWFVAATEACLAQSVWSLSGEAAAASDRTDRGLSITDEDVSIRGAVYLDHDDGLYGGLTLGNADDGRGNDVVLEGFVGHRRAIGAYEVDISVEAESFHGEDSFGYIELRVLALRDFGRLIISGGLAYAPDGRWFLRNRDQLYLFSDLDIPVRGAPWLSINLHGGFEATRDAANAWNWAAGLSANWRAFEGFAQYEQSGRAIDRADGRILGGIRFYF